ncbi:DNA alkylation repair protein [Streptomyces sp. NBRC 110465]|uniref:DNA alkylation repair protein n=1 Tax=Streptomyces sp. NBRC 110465 TaxID=1897621 RepID=UPI000A5213E6|nr:DNA alkylation repair protein [Streptomyces sp. NBRC 110465]
MCDRRNVRPVTPAADIPAPPVSSLADIVLERLVAAYVPAADPVRAEGAAAYMKHVAPFLGIPAPERRALARTVLAGTARPDERDCTAIALRCWRLPEREYHYFAVDYLRRHAGRCSSGFLPVLHHLVTTVPWWDTVDLLAAHVAGPLVAADPALAREMDRWIDDPSLWAARTALLHQLRYKEATDADRLFGYCLRRADHPDFFIRKAIGWALREYARTDPAAVREFVDGARSRLSPLSVREALKHL